MKPSLTPLCALMLGASVLAASADDPKNLSSRPRENWDFAFKDFVIGAWWGPDATDAELAAYAACGFNTVMSGRYMQLEDYGHLDSAQRELDLAHKHGLKVFFDTYTQNDNPWGGSEGPFDDHAFHHAANLEELTWLYERIGKHPALIGFMIGDDQGEVSERSHQGTQFLFEQGPPHLMPWLCGWISPENLAAHNNPIENPQIYPTLYSWDQSAEAHVQSYASAYAGFSRRCRDAGVIFWPMFNVAGVGGVSYCTSDSLTRFPAYAAIAYGAEGYWYFTYNNGSLMDKGPHRTAAAVKAALTPLYPVAQRANLRCAAWGPLVLGRTSTGLFGTAFGIAGNAETATATALTSPGPGKLIGAMDDDLIAGVLTAEGQRPLLMVVDCRATKGYDELEPREVTLTLSTAVRRVIVHEMGEATTSRGNTITLTLDACEGQLLELGGYDLDALCTEEAIYGPRI